MGNLKRLASLLGLILVSCQGGPVYADVTIMPAKIITWIKYNSDIQLNQMCRTLTNKPNTNFAGCSTWSDNGCVIYTLVPSRPIDPSFNDTVGHEVRHCFEGHYHP